jgi:hypothetical protein
MNTTLSSKISALTTGKKRRISSKAIFALVFYLVLPTIALSIIILTYPELSRDRLLGILYRIIPISITLILISQYQVRYGKGSKGRFILNEIYVVLIVLWLFALLGGKPVIDQTWEEYQFSLHIWNYIVLILVVTSMNVLYYAMEYKAYSKKNVSVDGSEREEGAIDEEVEHKGVTISTVQAQ